MSLKECHTDQLPLSPDPMKNAADVLVYKKSLHTTIKALGLEVYRINYLVDNYGKQTTAILEKMKEYDNKPEIALARAELWFGVNHELVISPMDFFARRSGRLYFDITSIATVKNAVLADLQSYFLWTKAELEEEKEELEQALFEAANFSPLAKQSAK